MKTNNQSLIPWFNFSFFLGIVLSLIAGGLLIFEVVKNGNWFVESLLGQLGIGLLLIYFSGKPMVDERIRFLKFKGLAIGFIITCISSTLINYILTYPDGQQVNSISSYWFTLFCLIIAFVSFGVLKYKE